LNHLIPFYVVYVLSLQQNPEHRIFLEYKMEKSDILQKGAKDWENIS